MLGFISGIVLAIFYRKQGPQRPVYEWMDEEETEETEEEKGRMGEEEKI